MFPVAAAAAAAKPEPKPEPKIFFVSVAAVLLLLVVVDTSEVVVLVVAVEEDVKTVLANGLLVVVEVGGSVLVAFSAMLVAVAVEERLADPSGRRARRIFRPDKTSADALTKGAPTSPLSLSSSSLSSSLSSLVS